MNTQVHPSPQFFMTAPAPCPYLPGQTERKVFTHLVGQRAPEMNDILTQGGFRRSQNIAYRPACEACTAWAGATATAIVSGRDAGGGVSSTGAGVSAATIWTAWASACSASEPCSAP